MADWLAEQAAMAKRKLDQINGEVRKLIERQESKIHQQAVAPVKAPTPPPVVVAAPRPYRKCRVTHKILRDHRGLIEGSEELREYSD